MDSYDDSLDDNQPIDNQPTHRNAPTCTFGAGHHSLSEVCWLYYCWGVFHEGQKNISDTCTLINYRVYPQVKT